MSVCVENGQTTSPRDVVLKPTHEITIETSVDDAFKWTEIPVLMFARNRGDFMAGGVVRQIRT